MFLEINLDCRGRTYKNVTLTAYFPSYDEDFEGGLRDMKGELLKTLQDFLDDRNQYVTLAMDEKLEIPYGTTVCIPQLNQHFGHRIRIQVRDTSTDLTGTGYSRADICVRSETDSYDKNLNEVVTLVFDSV
ncbi:lipase [Holotrichia oblita]|uniref:Lipase n=1 Tax=Holotrichia oblita TaxID=644536 RepID=A0ACB9T421_HOLOL|nr:lipase [Holotrichia oblita]